MKFSSQGSQPASCVVAKAGLSLLVLSVPRDGPMLVLSLDFRSKQVIAHLGRVIVAAHMQGVTIFFFNFQLF